VKALVDEDAAQHVADRVRLDLALAAAGNVGVWDGDLVSRRIYADGNFARIYGVDAAQAIAGQPLGHYFGQIHPEDRDAAQAAMTALVESGAGEFSHQHRIWRPDGTVRWVLARGRLVHDAAGRMVRLPGLSFDITEHRQAEARQAFLLDLLDGLRGLENPLSMLDFAVCRLGRHLAVARAGYAEVGADQTTMTILCGYTDGVPPLNQTMHMDRLGAGNAARVRQGLTVVHEDVQTDVLNATETFRQLGSRGMISVPLMRDGVLRATLWVATTAPRAWEKGEVALVEDVAARLWDALERARAEAALREANALLEHRVAAALEARERVEEALRQSQKMEAVGQLTGGIAHDFNNMLQGISSAVELMRRRIESGKPERAAPYVEAAQAGIARAASLTHRLLAFSRRQALAPRRIDVAELMQGTTAMIRQTVGPSIDVRLELADPCWPVECDPNQLENALLNLAINARDAMPDGGTLTVQAALDKIEPPGRAGQNPHAPADIDPGEFVRITVRDTGQGMPPEILAHAFEPFFTTKPAGQGTGLGLSQVYGFVSQSNGFVHLQSAAGQGTSVHLFLPRHAGAGTPDAAASPPRPGILAHGATVLLVEDEAPIRRFLAEALGDLGCRVITAETGPAGLAALRKPGTRVDLLVTDVGLPGGMNGRQLADAARTDAPGLPVLLITGYAGDAIGKQALPAGIVLLTKPFTLEDLMHRLSAMLPPEPASAATGGA
jgi:PAS domain S-box-containing protein